MCSLVDRSELLVDFSESFVGSPSPEPSVITSNSVMFRCCSGDNNKYTL